MRKMNKGFLMLSFFLTSVLSFYAQQQNEFALSYTANPNAGFKENIDGNANFSNVTMYTSFMQKAKNKKVFYNHRFDFGFLTSSSQINNGTANNLGELDLYKIGYTFAYNRALEKNWLMSAMVSPAVASDFQGDFNSDDFNLMASVNFVKIKSPSLQYGFGLAYSNQFGDDLVIPYPFVSYQKNNLKLQMVLPRVSILFSNEKKNLEYGLEGVFTGGVYNIEASVNGNYIRQQAFNFGPKLSVKMNNSLTLNVAAGYALARRWEYLDNNYDTVLDLSPESDFFFNVGLKFVPTAKNKTKQ